MPSSGSVSLSSLTAGTLGVTLALGSQNITSSGNASWNTTTGHSLTLGGANSLLILGAFNGTQGDGSFGLGGAYDGGGTSKAGLGSSGATVMLYNVASGGSHSFEVAGTNYLQVSSTGCGANALTALSGNLVLTGGAGASGAVICNDRLQVASATSLTNDPGIGGVYIWGNLLFGGAGGNNSYIKFNAGYNLLMQVPGAGNGAFFIEDVSSGNMLFKASSGSGLCLGIASLATTATLGFPYIPVCAGAPTGTPTSVTGMVPMVFDSTNKRRRR